jgi:hypothetical protein
MTNPAFCFDAWTIRRVANDDFGKENWHFHDTVDYLHDIRNHFFKHDDPKTAIEHVDDNDLGFFANWNHRIRHFSGRFFL